jgi:hypothetical protein
VSVFLILYALLNEVQNLTPALAQGSSSPLPSWVFSLAHPLSIALVLSVFLPTAPLLADFEAALRKKLHRLAQIPTNVQSLANRLKRSTLSVPEPVQMAVSEVMWQRGFEEGDLSFRPEDRARYCWTKLFVLIHQLDAWQQDPKVLGLIKQFEPEYEAILRTRDELGEQAQICFAMKRSQMTDTDERLRRAANAYEAQFLKRCEALLQSLYDLISRAALTGFVRDSVRWAQLKTLGFEDEDLKDPNQVATSDQLVQLFLLCALILFGAFLVGQRSAAIVPQSFGQTAARTLTISSVILASVWCAVYVKSRSGRARARTWTAYMLAGALAMLLRCVISFLGELAMLRILEDGRFDLAQAWFEFQQATPWILMPFVIAFLTAFNLDNQPSLGLHGRWLRLVEGAFQGSMLVLTAAVVNLQLSPSKAFPWHLLLPSSLGIGFLIGWYIPAWYRRVAPLNEGV